MVEETLKSKYALAVIGLGYVGLPLAVAFGKKFNVVGFDINHDRVAALAGGYDDTGELTTREIAAATLLRVSTDETLLAACNVFIITVPTPLDPQKKPDLQFLIRASETVAKFLKKDSIVIYESTVYPGCTEEDCVPVLEKVSGLVYNQDFFCGYSPERINPGDRVHTLVSIVKVTSGSTPPTADIVDSLYASIITAGTYRAPSIKVAEAAKAIENAQRDVNISFMNELSLIFDRMGIDTTEVLEAASTKWNFLPFRPGLVGGHCIGVDPHYLAYKALALGYEPTVILSGRMVNEQMSAFVAQKTDKLLKAKFGPQVKGKHVLILGMAFKENCSDTRNTKAVDIYQELLEAGYLVSIYDPLVNAASVMKEWGIQLINELPKRTDALIIAVAHDVFRTIDFGSIKEQGTVIFDTKGILGKGLADARL